MLNGGLGTVAPHSKMLIGLEGAHAFYVSIFGGVEHLRTDVRASELGGSSI